MAEGTNMDLLEQKQKIQSLIQTPLQLNDTWFLIEAHWFKKWQIYVSYESFTNTLSPSNNLLNNPGPIDNSSLFKSNSLHLKLQLIEEVDYFILPEDAWNLLVEWYSVVDNQTAIARKVINDATYKKNLKIEIYYLELKLCLFSNMENVIIKEFSHVSTIDEVETYMREHFHISQSSEIRLWSKYMSNSYDQLKKSSGTLQEANLISGQVIVLEEKSSISGWPFNNKFNNTETSLSRMYTPGLCGLSNLGNTCFMNSALQCMSNVPILTDYMMSDKWKLELNKENPLGMNGEIAISYAELIRNIWSGRQNCTIPRAFKCAVGHFKLEFSGFQQQDSQELMAFLLDGLHEDLNRIKKKPYIEAKETDNRPDEEVANETWIDYNKRNNSIIVDTFHGLLKSTIICPECQKVSIKFDPFCYLSLPLPMKKERQIDVFFVSLNPAINIKKCKITTQKVGTINELCVALSQIVSCPANRMIVTDVYSYRFHKLFSHNDFVNGIADRDDIYVYEIPPENPENPQIIISVYMREIKKRGNSSCASPQLFGLPLLMPIPKNNCSYDVIYNAIKERIRRYIKQPYENHNGLVDCNDENYNEPENDVEDEDDNIYDSKSSSSVDKSIKKKDFKFFELRHVNAFGSADMCEIPADGKPIQFTGHAYIAADWLQKTKEKYFEEKTIEMVDMDDSMQNKPTVRKITHLMDCLKLFTTKEQLGEQDTWFCPICKKLQQATKKFDIWSLPKVLVIHLKRFSYNRYLRDKLDSIIEFPVENLIMEGFVSNSVFSKISYNLIAVSNHYGGLGGGHYTAYAKNRLKNKWYHFDDSSVSEISENEIVTKAAYVLVYEAKNWPLAQDTTNNSTVAEVDLMQEDDEMDTGSSS